MIANATTYGFGTALTNMYAGRRVRRKGWNGAGMFLFLIQGGWDFTTDVPDVDGLETSAFVCMRTAQGRLVPWLASQTDVLAYDWETLPDESE